MRLTWYPTLGVELELILWLKHDKGRTSKICAFWLELLHVGAGISPLDGR